MVLLQSLEVKKKVKQGEWLDYQVTIKNTTEVKQAFRITASSMREPEGGEDDVDWVTPELEIEGTYTTTKKAIEYTKVGTYSLRCRVRDIKYNDIEDTGWRAGMVECYLPVEATIDSLFVSARANCTEPPCKEYEVERGKDGGTVISDIEYHTTVQPMKIYGEYGFTQVSKKTKTDVEIDLLEQSGFARVDIDFSKDGFMVFDYGYVTSYVKLYSDAGHTELLASGSKAEALKVVEEIIIPTGKILIADLCCEYNGTVCTNETTSNDGKVFPWSTIKNTSPEKVGMWVKYEFYDGVGNKAYLKKWGWDDVISEYKGVEPNQEMRLKPRHDWVAPDRTNNWSPGTGKMIAILMANYPGTAEGVEVTRKEVNLNISP